MKTTTLPATLATISKVEGEVFIRGADGAMRAAKVGEQLSTLDTLLTKGGANAVLMLPNGQSMVVAPEGEYRLVVETSGVPADVAPAEGGGAEVAQVIEALEAGRDLSEELEAAAAGLTGGGADAGHSFVRLTRVSEATTPLAYEFPSEGESELLPFNAPAGAAESAEATEPPPVDLEPVAVDDHGRAAVVVRGQEGDFNGNARVMGAGEGAMSFETRLAIPHNQDVWLISDASFKGDVLGKLEGEFKITDKGEGSDPAFVVTPNFMADAGDTFSFTASTNLNPGDEFKAEVYVKGDGGWSLYDTIAGDGDYSYTFAAEGEYRVQFTVDDNTGGQGQASATIDITSGGFFSTGGGSDVTYEAAEGNIFENDTFGDGDFADHSWSFA
ncbi:MAG: retention module-containing protein, partial [Rhodocyclaceae bacterium]|nr:retention module-containing protein [Rhodocyclaceae bacterium]